MLPNNKKITHYLSSIFGINTSTSQLICKKKGINPFLKLKNLNLKKKQNLKFYVKHYYLINDKLKKQINLKKTNLIKIKSYKGLRSKKGLPVRGQRTHTNAKTATKIIKNFKKN